MGPLGVWMEVTGAKVILLESKQPPRYAEYADGATWWLLVATAARDESNIRGIQVLDSLQVWKPSGWWPH